MAKTVYPNVFGPLKRVIFENTNPENVPVPKTDEIFEGTFNGNKWIKFSSGEIKYEILNPGILDGGTY